MKSEVGDNERRLIRIGVASSAVFQLIAGRWLFHLINNYTEESRASIINFADKLEYVAAWEALFGILIMLAVMAIGNHRFSGTQQERHGYDSDALRVKKNFLQNSLEQSFIMVLLHLGLLKHLTAETVALIPVSTVLFMIGRLAFYVGYMIHPPYRAFGFATGALQQVFLVGVIIYLNLSQLKS
jgi:uncharacterized MAPEG superfamily protein